jgi:hypothetical protein
MGITVTLGVFIPDPILPEISSYCSLEYFDTLRVIYPTVGGARGRLTS